MLRILKTMLLAAVPFAAIGLASSNTEAAHWSKHKGYWYYYDNNGAWNYNDGTNWYRYRNGRWHYRDGWNGRYDRGNRYRYRYYQPYYGWGGYYNRYYGGRGFGVWTPFGGFQYYR